MADSNLIGERARHDKRWGAGGTTQIDGSAFCQNDDTMAIKEDEAIDLHRGSKYGQIKT